MSELLNGLYDVSFPIYIGPFLKNCVLVKVENYNLHLHDEKAGKLFVIDEYSLVENKTYDERLMEIRNDCNGIDDRKYYTDLPMVKVSDMGEFMREQKNHLTDGHQGVIFFSAYSESFEYQTIMFKRNTDDNR